MGVMAVMHQQEGDVKIIWNPDNEDEVAVARNSFNELIGKKFRAYAVREKGAKGDPVTTFDPRAEKLIMVPAVAGG